MTPLHVKEESGHKPDGTGSKMCRESQRRGTTNFPPIAEYSRLTSPTSQRRAPNDERGRREPHRPTGAPSMRPRSNSDYSLVDVWSSGRRSICSSNGRSSLSSSGDASTIASTEKLWRRRKLSPRRIINRPVTPFPAEEILNNPGEVENDTPMPSPPQTKSSTAHQPAQTRRMTSFSLTQNHQPIAEEQGTGKITSNNLVRRKTEECLERKPQPPTQYKDAEATKASERRRRKSMPEIYQKPNVEARKTDTSSKKSEARVLTEIMDHVARERIMNWLTEVAHAKDEGQETLQQALSAIDEE